MKSSIPLNLFLLLSDGVSRHKTHRWEEQRVSDRWRRPGQWAVVAVGICLRLPRLLPCPVHGCFLKVNRMLGSPFCSCLQRFTSFFFTFYLGKSQAYSKIVKNNAKHFCMPLPWVHPLSTLRHLCALSFSIYIHENLSLLQTSGTKLGTSSFTTDYLSVHLCTAGHFPTHAQGAERPYSTIIPIQSVLKVPLLPR